MSKTRSKEFEIIKEPWNKYEISDGSVLKTRTVLKQIRREMENNKPRFSIDTQPFTVIHAEPALCGAKNDERVTQEDMAKAVDKDDMRYDTISQEFNEYVLDDGSKIKLYTNVTKISRTKINNSHGEPLYFVYVSSTMDIKLASQYT